MAFGIGNLGNIVEDFTNSVAEILGGATGNTSNTSNKGGEEGTLFNSKVGGTVRLEQDKWIGNAGSQKNKVRYGFATMTLSQVTAGGGLAEATYYLDIPPQSIQQKENFANNIQATRKGVVVETEGVVFRDIVIQGTTGIFPGKRGSSNSPAANFSDFTAPPSAPSGVDEKTGRSKASNVKTISGYEEFIKLRQFFLAYAQRKVESDGDLFLVFINEKDNQNLIVEPLDFTMNRNARSPMTYEYKIQLKGIGDLNNLIGGSGTGAGNEALSLLEQIGNVSANIQASIQQGRAIFNQSIRLLTRISQSVDQTINGPLRQIQFATEDIGDGVATALSLPEILIRNTTDAILNTRENIDDIGATVNSALGARGGFSAATGAGTSRVESASERATAAASFTQQRDILDQINGDNRTPVPRSFLEQNKADLDNLQYNLADFVGLGDASFDAIKGRTSTITADPLKVVSDEEFIVLGQLANVSNSINQALATNVLFEPDAEISFQQATAQFRNDTLPEDQQIEIRRPNSVKEVTIQQGDTLERIAQREYGDALRWVDLVVLNNLKPPYVSNISDDGVKAFGESIIVGVD